MTDTIKIPTKVRYCVLAAVFVNVVINYMDRSNISVAGSMISKELNLDTAKMGYVFSAFGWTYAYFGPGFYRLRRLRRMPELCVSGG